MEGEIIVERMLEAVDSELGDFFISCLVSTILHFALSYVTFRWPSVRVFDSPKWIFRKLYDMENSVGL